MNEVTNKSTVHGMSTPHGPYTPHKYPTASNSIDYTDIMASLSRQLYPTGRAWSMPYNGVFDNLHKAINRSFIRVVEASNSLINSTIPDNENFTLQDVELWEYRLGISPNDSVSKESRILAIKRKLSYRANSRYRQSKNFIEFQLRQAGFDVYVHENKYFDGVNWQYYTPDDISGIVTSEVQHSNDFQHGAGTQHGYSGYDVIANESTITESFSIGYGNLWATFFICGENLGDVATIPASRLVEFKELVLKLKPAHTVAFTFINYV